MQVDLSLSAHKYFKAKGTTKALRRLQHSSDDRHWRVLAGGDQPRFHAVPSKRLLAARHPTVLCVAPAKYVTWLMGARTWLCLGALSPREAVSLRAKHVNLFLVW